MSSTGKTIGIVCLAAAAIALVLGSGVAISALVDDKKDDGKAVIDETFCMIGFPKEVPMTDGSATFNPSLNIYCQSGKYETVDTYATGSKYAEELESQEAGTLWVDVASIYSGMMGGQSFKAWVSAANPVLRASTIYSNNATESALVDITDCGWWLINVVKKSGSTPAVVHSYQYTKTVYQSSEAKS